MSKPRDPTQESEVARLEKALKAAEAVIEDQRQRLKALGAGREQTMMALADVRAELERVRRERDALRKQLERVDGVQTSTIALPDDEAVRSPTTSDVPSLDELMNALGHIEEEGPRGPRIEGHLHQRVQAPETDAAEEMLSPEVVFPEKFAATAESARHAAPVSRVLVLMDPERPIKYPLFKDTMTIGRADSADIQIDHGFLSRLHARVISTADGVTIEDYESKNGVRVNSKPVTRQKLCHGDVIDLGRLRFRFIDTTADAD